MDCLYDVGIAFKVVLDAGNLLCIGKQPLHFRFRAAVAELQVVEHRVILLCKSLIGVLDALHRAAHLVCIVSHVHDCTVCDLCSLCRVTVK